MSASDNMTTAQAVRSMLLLMPRLVGRAKRLPVPAALRGMDLAPRHLALLAYLQYDGPLTVSELADRLVETGMPCSSPAPALAAACATDSWLMSIW